MHEHRRPASRAQSEPQSAAPEIDAPAAVPEGVKRQYGLVQRKATGAAPDGASTQSAAADGVAGPGGALPFFDRIQSLFGRHGVGQVRAHQGPRASAAARAMNARAYASGDDVAFDGEPSLHDAAHEAAHTVQQRAGVHLKGGVGQSGDAYEEHADQVADAVVAGRSAEALLDRHAPSGGATRAVQHKLADVTGAPLAPHKLETLFDHFRGSSHHARLHRMEGLTVEAIDQALADVASDASAELRVPLGEGMWGDPILQQLADRVRAFLAPRYRGYQGTCDGNLIKNFPLTIKDNLVVGNHFYSRATGDELCRGLSAGKNSVLGLVDVALPGWKVDSVEWGIFQFIGEPRFFLVRSSVGEVNINGKWAPEAGLHCIAHTHPADPGDRINRAVAPAPLERQVTGGFAESQFKDPKHAPLQKAEGQSGIPLLLALDAMVASKVMAQDHDNDLFHLFPSDADFAAQRPGELVYTPYRYERSTGKLYNFEHQRLPTLVWETVDKQHFKGVKTPTRDPWVKIALRLYASDRPGETLWSHTLYSMRLAFGVHTYNRSVFEPDLCD